DRHRPSLRHDGLAHGRHPRQRNDPSQSPLRRGDDVRRRRAGGGWFVRAVQLSTRRTDAMNELVTRTRDGDVGIITINNPPVNALSLGVPEGIRAGLEEFRGDASIKAVVLIGGGRTFIAGADINEFGKITSGQRKADIGLHALLEALENYPKPVVAAIHGTAFGGGLETAMACHYRVAVPSAKVGQPEGKLGLIPGAGGPQGLPRLAGVAKAAEMCAIGEPVGASDALRFGIIDQIVEGDLLADAVAFARQVVATGRPPRRTCDLPAESGKPAHGAV